MPPPRLVDGPDRHHPLRPPEPAPPGATSRTGAPRPAASPRRRQVRGQQQRARLRGGEAAAVPGGRDDVDRRTRGAGRGRPRARPATPARCTGRRCSRAPRARSSAGAAAAPGRTSTASRAPRPRRRSRATRSRAAPAPAPRATAAPTRDDPGAEQGAATVDVGAAPRPAGRTPSGRGPSPSATAPAAAAPAGRCGTSPGGGAAAPARTLRGRRRPTAPDPASRRRGRRAARGRRHDEYQDRHVDGPCRPFMRPPFRIRHDQ